MVKACPKKNKMIHSVRLTRKERLKYRACLILLLVLNMGIIGAWYWKKMDSKVPGHIYLFQKQIDFGVPLEGSCNEAENVIAITNGNTAQGSRQYFGLDRPVRVRASALGSYQAELKLFGIFHYKYIQFDVIEEAKVMPSGRAVGLYIQSDGIMVLGTSEIQGEDGFSYEPAKDILQPGDTIRKVEGTKVGDIDQVVELLQKKKGSRVKLEIVRGGNVIEVKLE